MLGHRTSYSFVIIALVLLQVKCIEVTLSSLIGMRVVVFTIAARCCRCTVILAMSMRGMVVLGPCACLLFTLDRSTAY